MLNNGKAMNKVVTQTLALTLTIPLIIILTLIVTLTLTLRPSHSVGQSRHWRQICYVREITAA